MLGHHSVAFTLEVYCHVLEEMKVNAAEKIGNFLRLCFNEKNNSLNKERWILFQAEAGTFRLKYKFMISCCMVAVIATSQQQNTIPTTLDFNGRSERI